MMKMKILLSALWVCLTYVSVSFAQPNKILGKSWLRCYGGSAAEAQGFAFSNNGSPQVSFAVAPNGNIYLLTHSVSDDGLVRQNKGDEDIWLVKLKPNGDTIWSKVYGGTGVDRPSMIKLFPNGDIVVVGRTDSNNGDFTGNKGNPDGLVMRLDSNGVIKWYRQYGGSGIESFYDVLIDGNRLVVVGETGSSDGDLSNVNVGEGEAWMVVLNANNGNFVWQRVTAAPRQPNNNEYMELFWSVVKCADNSGYVAAGLEGHFQFFNTDHIFVVKYSNTGNKLWEASLGSSEQDNIAQIIEFNNQLYVLGQVRANDEDVTGYLGEGDFWLVTLDAQGNLIRQRCYGGSAIDDPLGMTITPDNKLLLYGRTQSTNLMASRPSAGAFDAWALVVEPSTGDTLQTIRFGGEQSEAIHQAIFVPNYLLFAGRTNSSNSDFSGNFGEIDAFIAKFQTCYPTKPAITQRDDTLFVQGVTTLVENYNWYLNGNSVATTNEPFLLASQAGSYTVETQNGLCISPLSNSFIVSSLAKNHLKNEIQLYPNPVVNAVTLQTTLMATVSVLDMAGKVMQHPTTFPAGTHPISLTHLPTGMYIVRVQTEKGIFTQKIIKE